MFIVAVFIAIITAPVWALWLLVRGAIELYRLLRDILEEERGNAQS